MAPAEDVRRRYRNDGLRWTAAASGKFAAKTADRASEAAKSSAAAAAAAAFEVEKRAVAREDVSCLAPCSGRVRMLTFTQEAMHDLRVLHLHSNHEPNNVWDLPVWLYL